MHYRKLGASEAEISEIGLGAWGIGGNQWQGSEDGESLRALKRAFELGVNFVDTALAYGDGHSERLVGRAVREGSGPMLGPTRTSGAARLKIFARAGRSATSASQSPSMTPIPHSKPSGPKPFPQYK